MMGTRQDEIIFKVILSHLVFRGSRFRLVSGLLVKSREVSRLCEKGEIYSSKHLFATGSDHLINARVTKVIIPV